MFFTNSANAPAAACKPNVHIEFMSMKPLKVEIKYRSRTAPPTLPMVKTFDAGVEWQAEPATEWNSTFAFKKLLGELKFYLAADPGQNEIIP